MKVDKSSEQSPMTRLARKLLNGTTEGSHVYRMADQNLRFPYDLEEIINGRENTWLAVVHADGNGLGALIQKINADMAKNPAKTADVFARFSEALDKATAEAAHKAFDEVVAPGLDKTLKSLPLRPLILGGDDLTLIIRADLAVPFTESFLKAFQEFTANRMGEVGISGLEKGLTACAGIAFVKHSYPFHYGYELAESLCTQAKQASKSSPSAANGMIPASLALFKVQSTFSEDWKTIRERELQVKAFEGARSLHLDYGPYALNDGTGMPTIKALNAVVNVLSKPNAPVSGLRRWLTLIHDEPAQSEFFLERLKTVTGTDFDNEVLSRAFYALGSELDLRTPYCARGGNLASPVVDILTLLGVA